MTKLSYKRGYHQKIVKYPPLNLCKMGLNYGGKAGYRDITKKDSNYLICPPLYNYLLATDRNQQVEDIQKFDFLR
jgi:hypothetical protein